jgi:hypothetical protein
MPNPDDNGNGPHLRPAAAIRADNCPMCDTPMSTDDVVICCSECGGEGCTEHCIPGGRGTACVDCESDGDPGDDMGPEDDDA